MGPVKPLPPGLLVCKELAAKGGLQKPLSRYRHGAPIGFEKEVRNLPALRGVREAEAEDTIRLNPSATRSPGVSAKGVSGLSKPSS